MTAIEKLEKLVEKGIKFEVSNLQFSLIWKTMKMLEPLLAWKPILKISSCVLWITVRTGIKQGQTDSCR